MSPLHVDSCPTIVAPNLTVVGPVVVGYAVSGVVVVVAKEYVSEGV